MTFEEHCRQVHSLPDICCPDCGFEITLEEARTLNKLLRLHAGLFREQFAEYEQLLRLINGIGSFVDKHDQR